MANGQNTANLDLVRMNGGTVEVTNCYKTISVGTYGTHCIFTTSAPSQLGNLVHDYGLVKAYEKGLFWDGKYYIALTTSTNAGTEGDPYIIANEADWASFAQWIKEKGDGFTGEYVQLTADITVSTPAGTSEAPFSGTFLGNGHAITANISDTGSGGTALFRNINGATIKDLTVGGTITGGLHAAAIVGFAQGTGNSIRNCVVTANVSGGTHIGGILGHGTTSDVTISGCVFSGTMTGGGTAKGAIVGWGESDGTKTVTDCLYLMANGQNTGGLDLVRMNGGTVSVENSYKTTSAGSYGMFTYAYTTAPGDLGDQRQDYGVLTAYENAILYDGTYYVAPATLSGSGTETDPYLISNTYEWDAFTLNVNSGTNYSGKYVKLTDDINATAMAGLSETNSFQGTFDGGGHTLTVNYDTSKANTAPFRHVKNAAVKNLHVTGIITTSAQSASGIVAESHGALSLTNCCSSVIINSLVSGDGSHGGLVGTLSGSDNAITIDGCVFDGSFATTNGTTNCGGFVGWPVHNRPTIKNSLMNPGSVDAGMLTNTFARWSEGYEPTITNCYYTETAGDAQGTQCFPATVEPANLGELVQDYGVLKAYQNGILYGSMYYVATTVSISLADDADNSTTLSENNGYMAHVTLQGRTLYMDGAWNTLCLPFDVTLSDSPLNGAEARPLTDSYISGSTLNLTFGDEVKTLVAGTPYIIRWPSSDRPSYVVFPVFTGAVISNVTAKAETEYVDFVGCYSPVSIYTDEKTNLYLGADNKLYYPTASDFKVNAFRGYFQLKQGLTAGEAANSVRAFVLNFGDDEGNDINASGIITTNVTNSTNSDNAWYTLDGRKLGGKPTQRGIYVNNGRKVVIK